jgi:pimeloyl-ACP methyl ester carboxylesterase
LSSKPAVLLLLHAMVFCLALAVAAARTPPSAKLQPCKLPGLERKIALCGTYQVWENRTAKSGRRIGLEIVVLPALSFRPKSDPVFVVAGGPGQSATSLARFSVADPLRRHRALVFVDQRGTGEPNRLACELGGREDDFQSYLGEVFPVEEVRACRERLEKDFDLTFYTTELGVDDLDEVRAWLGYGRINLIGSSYGSRVVQVYLRRHPQSVRTAILSGVVPMDEALPISFAAGGQRSLDLLLGWCERDAACQARFPNVREELAAVLDRLAQSPVTAEVLHPRTRQPVQMRLSREIVADGIRWLLYNPADSARLPLLIHRAAAGDFAPLGQASVAARFGMIRKLALGMFLSVTCAEDIPFIDPAEVVSRTAGSFLGDDRVRRQMAACSIWPRARIEAGHREAIQSEAPVLLISGERDPVTPPDFAVRAARHLTQGVHVVVPYGSHGNDGSCIREIQRKFIDRGFGERLDTSCVSRMRMTPFVVGKPRI